MAKNVIRPVKGTTDFYPELMGLRTYLYEQMQLASEKFGYQQYEGPILESFELYAAKSGEELVEKQSYVFEDRSGDKVTLRPELTPTLARMVATKQSQLTFPLRWWSFGPFWRYERPQKGRTREFFQWNIDMIGDDSPEADAELIAVAATFLKQLGLKPTEVQILVNNRKLIDQEISKLGVPAEKQQAVFQWIDSKDKRTPEIWQQEGEALGLSSDQISSIETLFSNADLWKNSEELTRVFAALEAFGVSKYVTFAPHIIRGLQYYTGTVFEAWDTDGEFRALFGGGRYDNLIGDVGGNDVSAVGFAVGHLVLSLLLESKKLLPEFTSTPAEIYMTVFNEGMLEKSLALTAELRAEGFRVTGHLSAAKIGKQFKYADRIGAKVALVLGPDEAENKTIAVKNLSNGEQEVIPQSDLFKHLKEMLESI